MLDNPISNHHRIRSGWEGCWRGLAYGLLLSATDAVGSRQLGKEESDQVALHASFGHLTGHNCRQKVQRFD